MNETVNDIDYQNKPRNNGKVIVGMVLLVIGGILLLKQFTYFDIPNWIWSWPSWILLWGLYSGAKHNWRNSSALILVFIGIAFMLNEAIPNIHMGAFIWPVAVIGVGIWIILKRNHSWDK